uniref:Exostosin GT47 domain-containing protein n=1 Tax=Kalanchoe fedtschenkoi TaxID=63787 RepID=A0A7N0REI6_KALFE
MKKTKASSNNQHRLRLLFLIVASFLVCFIALYGCYVYGLAGFSYLSASAYLGSFKNDACAGKYIFVHQLPPKFNFDLLRRCETLSYHMKDMCVYLQNDGFGPPMAENSSIFEAGSWFATDQFSLEVIFHSRMKRYECLTNDSSSADALYVPFYAALEAGRNLESQNTTVRDKAPMELMDYISSQKEWSAMEGRDHFLVAGRIAWDFRRSIDDDTYWGNKLMNLPQSEQITMLTIESTTYHENEAGAICEQK